MGSVDPRVDGAVVGIDLGTTNSVIATVTQTGLEVIRDRRGNSLVPSVVAFVPNGEILVGRRARERALLDPLNTIHSAKRIIGRPCSAPQAQRIIAQLPYSVSAGANEEPIIKTRAGPKSVVEISARVLAHLRAGAQQRIGRVVSGCVVTVPANFSDSQREATRRAAVAAGMDVLRVLNEPTAAALALGLGDGRQRRVGVFDMGGGTFDFTVLAVHDGLFEVLATGGEPYLGGDDFDDAIANRFADAFLREHRVDLNASPEARAQLLRAAEGAKITLSNHGMAEGLVPAIAYGEGGRELDLSYSISRADFEAMIAKDIDRALSMTSRVLAEAGLSALEVDEIALVGGSTLIPVVQRRVKRLFGREPNTTVNPLDAVAIGASLHAHTLWMAAHHPPTSATAPPTTTMPGKTMPGTAGPGATPAATSPATTLPATTLPATTIPSVASPATTAKYAPVSGGLLMDVTSHALGIATVGDNVEVLIDKNTTIPCEGNRVFSTVRDNQVQVSIRVCQGEARRFSESVLLGELSLTNLRPAPRGDTQVSVEFIVDANGILQVSARDVATGQQAQAVLSVRGLERAAG